MYASKGETGKMLEAQIINTLLVCDGGETKSRGMSCAGKKRPKNGKD